MERVEDWDLDLVSVGRFFVFLSDGVLERLELVDEGLGRRRLDFLDNWERMEEDVEGCGW